MISVKQHFSVAPNTEKYRKYFTAKQMKHTRKLNKNKPTNMVRKKKEQNKNKNKKLHQMSSLFIF
jgi:hypothetical protein